MKSKNNYSQRVREREGVGEIMSVSCTARTEGRHVPLCAGCLLVQVAHFFWSRGNSETGSKTPASLGAYWQSTAKPGNWSWHSWMNCCTRLVVTTLFRRKDIQRVLLLLMVKKVIIWCYRGQYLPAGSGSSREQCTSTRWQLLAM